MLLDKSFPSRILCSLAHSTWVVPISLTSIHHWASLGLSRPNPLWFSLPVTPTKGLSTTWAWVLETHVFVSWSFGVYVIFLLIHVWGCLLYWIKYYIISIQYLTWLILRFTFINTIFLKLIYIIMINYLSFSFQLITFFLSFIVFHVKIITQKIMKKEKKKKKKSTKRTLRSWQMKKEYSVLVIEVWLIWELQLASSLLVACSHVMKEMVDNIYIINYKW